MLNVLAVGAGGFLGAVCRYLIGLIPLQESFVFPIKTLMINVVGCLVIGWIAAVGSRHAAFGPQLLLFLKVGLCGGFTTFSTFALETADLMKTGHPVAAILYVVLSVLAGVAAVFLMESVSAS
jgi:CrcB protein